MKYQRRKGKHLQRKKKDRTRKQRSSQWPFPVSRGFWRKSGECLRNMISPLTHFLRFLPIFHPFFTHCLLKFYSLFSYCLHIVQPLSIHCSTIVNSLFNHCQLIVQPLSTHCSTIVNSLFTHCLLVKISNLGTKIRRRFCCIMVIALDQKFKK